MVYSFATQLAKGKEVENQLDLFFSSRYDIERVGMAHERRGIDRIYRRGEKTFTVEYKADFKSYSTGNCFAETVAYGKYNEDGIFVPGKLGWVHTSEADYLLYLVVHPEDVPSLGEAYVVEPKALRAWVEDWSERYRTVKVYNEGFQGRGVLVPLSVLEKVSVRKLLIASQSE